MTESPWMLLPEAAAYIRKTPLTLRRYIARGWIRPGKAGSEYLFTKEMLDKFVMRGNSER